MHAVPAMVVAADKNLSISIEVEDTGIEDQQ